MKRVALFHIAAAKNRLDLLEQLDHAIAALPAILERWEHSLADVEWTCRQRDKLFILAVQPTAAAMEAQRGR